MKRNYCSQSVLLTLFTIVGASLCSLNSHAQESVETPLDTLTSTVQNLVDEVGKSRRLKITGYLQPQFQMIDSAGAPSFAGGDFASGVNSRITMRRGRFKFTYEYENAEFMLNTDATERGYALRETYVKITDPWLKMFSVTTGLLQYQFGYEVTQSSSMRETPERARYNQTLFPTERDLGVFGRMQFPKYSKFYGISVDVAVMNGAAGVVQEFDSYKDYSGRVAYAKTTASENITFSIGASVYNGGYKTGNVKDYNYNSTTKSFVYASDTANYNRKAKRVYVGIDAQASVDWRAGLTTVRAEYIQGEQPGTDKSNRSPGALQTSKLYHRQFNGGYFYFIQNIGKSRLGIVAKYDWYDPNVKLSGRQIVSAGTLGNIADIRFDTYGFGFNYRITSNVKLMVYYDLVKNEKTLIAGYAKDIKDNVLTIRMQYKF